MQSHRKKLLAIILVILCATWLRPSCGAQSAIPASLALTVTGDVQNEIVLTSYDNWNKTFIQYRGESQEVIALAPILVRSGIMGEEITIFLSASDGAIAEIPLEQITGECWLRLSDEYGWQFISEYHPRQAGIKHISYIVVSAAKTGPQAPCVRMIEGTQETALTYGQLFAAEAIHRLVPEGEAKQDSFTTNVYSRRSLVPISQYLKDESKLQTTALAYFGDGSQEEIALAGFLEWRGNSADYLGPNGRSRKANVIGIWVDPPEYSLTDLAPEALVALKEGPVLVILLDGVGYHNLLASQPEFLCAKSPQGARTVMPSISPVGLGAIVTGRPPKENGITAKNMRELRVDDVFVKASNMGKTASKVGGSSKVISTSIDPLLNPDLNGNGSTDDEVFACAQRELAAGTDLVFVHFHGYDDVAHTYGPLSPEASAKLNELDEYVKDLCAGFAGTVFVISDHGQHPACGDKLGEHGEFRLLDMVVPWIQFKSRGARS